MQRLFQVVLRRPVENERGSIDLAYSQAGAKDDLNVALSGRGFQQFLLLFAYLFSHERAVLLIDEPDAHLEVIFDDAVDCNLSLIVDAEVQSVSGAAPIKNAQKHYGAAR